MFQLIVLTIARVLSLVRLLTSHSNLIIILVLALSSLVAVADALW